MGQQVNCWKGGLGTLGVYLVVTDIRPDPGLFQKPGKQESQVSDEAGDFKL